jgi:two-component system, OmpR family, response regulator RstA
MNENHILLVEDDVQIQRLLRSQLILFHFDVRCVDNGSDAMKEIAAGWPDMVLLDLKLNDESGIDICRR